MIVFILQDCRTLFPGLNPAKSSFAFRVDFVNFTFCTHKSNFACSSLICTCIFLQTLTSASSSRHHWLYLCHNLNGKISHLAPSFSDKCLKALNQLVIFFFSETIISGINRQPAEFTFHSVSDICSWYKRGEKTERASGERKEMKRRERGGGWWEISIEGPFNKMYDSAQFSLKNPHNSLWLVHMCMQTCRSQPQVSFVSFRQM